MALGGCMQTMKVEPGDSRDEKLRETFHPFTPDDHLNPPANRKHTWYYSYYLTKRVSTGSTNYINLWSFVKEKPSVTGFYIEHLKVPPEGKKKEPVLCYTLRKGVPQASLDGQ